jgi:hypothetical protein
MVLAMDHVFKSIVALGVPCITVNHMLILIKRDFICRLLRLWKLPYYVKLKIWAQPLRVSTY